MKEIILKKGKEESLLRFHPWVFSGAIFKLPEQLQEGETVAVRAADGTLMGVGHYEIGSIAVRILAWNDRELDLDFYKEKLQSALDLRLKLGLLEPKENKQSARLVHGEGDYLPGCIIDVYGDTAVFQAHSVGIHNARLTIAQALESIGYHNIYYKSDTTLPYKAQEHISEPLTGWLAGGFSSDIAIENGLKFHVDWLKGQKTGFFVDQRDNRALLERFAKNARLLNMFCYTGGFSVYAMRGGAKLVHSVDSSERATNLTKQNIELNFPDDHRHEEFATDAFKYLQEMPRGAYDVIILDPPAFAKHRNAIPNALRGYRRLNAAAIEKIAPGGIIFTFSCSQAITPEQFKQAVFSAAAQAKRQVRVLHRLSQPADHPVNIYHPEGEYLKGLVIEVE